MKILCVFGEHNYGNPSRGQSYEHANFLPAFNRLGMDVVFFESWNRDLYQDFSELNRRLLETVELEKPDVIFFVLLGYEIWLETLELLRELNVPLINWGTDDSWKYDQFSRFIAPSVDYYLTTSSTAFSRAEKDGFNHWILSQWAANTESLIAPLPSGQCNYQVSFIGSAYGNRPQWIDQLKRRGIEVSCFGYGWENGPVSTEEMRNILRESVMTLNFGDSGLHVKGLKVYRDRQIKARVFEVLGSGGFLLTEGADGLEKFLVPDEEVVVFHGIDELERKIRYFLIHGEARDRIAAKGHVRVVLEHTYDARFAAIFVRVRSVIEQRSLSRGEIRWATFDAAARKHCSARWMRLLRTLMIGLCRIFWGRARGARAARRIVYELSWRISGRSTFSSAGIPGRLFYHE